MRGAQSWVPAGVAVEEVSVDGLRVRCLRAGSGPALLLVHGLLGYAFSWRFNLVALAKQFTVLAPDLPGAGFSERREGMAGDLASAAARMERLLEILGAEEFDLLGTSHGGAVAILLAERARGRVRKLVLVAPANPWSRHGRLAIPVIATAAGRLATRAFVGARWLHPRWLARMYGDRRRIAPGTLQGYQQQTALPLTSEYAWNIFRSWRQDMRKVEAALPKLAGIPTLLVWGDKDPIVLPESAAELQRRLPGSRLRMIPGAGHLPYEEAPEEFNRVVTEFLVGPDGV